MKNIETKFGCDMSGQFKYFVVDTDENIVFESPWKSNLILNQGMEALAPGALPTHGATTAQAMVVACMGGGTRYNSISVGYANGEGSGSVTGTTFTFFTGSTGLQSLTASAGNGYANAVEIGDMLQFSGTLQEVRVLAVGNLSASVTGSTSVPLLPFIIFKTSQVGLQAQIHPGIGLNNIYNQPGYCGSTQVTNTLQMKRSWDFAYETSSFSVTEVGVGWSANGNNFSIAFGPTNVFSRILLDPTVSLNSGQKLRLIYQLNRSVTPYVTSSVSASIGDGLPITASIGGTQPWPIAPATNTFAYYNIQAYDWAYVDTNGNTQNNGGMLEPCNNVNLFWSEIGTPLLSSGNSNSRYNPGQYDIVGASSDPYTNLNFTVTKTGLFAASAGSVSIRSIGIMVTGQGVPANQTFMILFNQPQTKLNTQTLSTTWQYSWGRVLA